MDFGCLRQNGLGDLADRTNDVLAIVEHDQLCTRLQMGENLLQWLVLIERGQPEHRCEVRGKQIRVCQRSEVDELYAVAISVGDAQGDRQGDGGLADASSSGNRDQTAARKLIGDLGDNLVAAEDLGKSGGKADIVKGRDRRRFPIGLSLLARRADDLRHERIAAPGDASDEPRS